ncbi:ROK family protein [Sporichthya polymorpha]|uniref:ROK family protein n=1 Tax=Sporichthya polymorpha TaxID=35751 RepID=UPI00036DCF31|nr:ROK family protein [Sporichthya polymorpha]
MSVALAVDVGGTKLAAGLVDGAGTVLAADRVPTPRSPDAEVIWTALADLVRRVHAKAAAAPVGIGVGCGGPMVWPAGRVSPLNIGGWRDFPLRDRLRDLARELGAGNGSEDDVRIHNDAVCVAVAEHWRGAGRGRANVLGMVVSTGVGGGLVLGGRLVDGARGNAGHIGHVCVDPRGPECACGARGCLEAVASGPRTAAWARDEGWANPAGDDAATLTADARAGHPVALAALRRAGEALGVAIASAAHLCDLDVVAVGGGLAQAGDLLFGPLHAAYEAQARMDFVRATRIVPAALGQEAGLVGAAALVLGSGAYWSPGSSART